MDIAVIIAVLLILCLLIVRNHLLKLCRRQPGKKNVFPNRTCCPGHPHTWYLQIDDMGFPKCTKDKERSWSTLHSAEPAVQQKNCMPVQGASIPDVTQPQKNRPSYRK